MLIGQYVHTLVEWLDIHKMNIVDIYMDDIYRGF